MPVNRHLEWFDITDWTPGLYDEVSTQARRLLMPENACQELVNYVPQPQGGLRAFFAPTTVSTTGLDSAANEIATGLYQRGGLPLRSGASGDSIDRYLATMHGTDKKSRLYRMDGSNGETTWKQEAAPGNYDGVAASHSGARATEFDFMKTTAGDEYVLAVFRDTSVYSATQVSAGLFKIKYVGGAGPPATDGDLSGIASYTGPLAVAQARILIGAGNSERLYYGTVGDVVVDGTTYIDVEPNKVLPNLALLEPYAPADLIVVKEGGSFVVIGGDISDAGTPVREMGQGHFARFTEQEFVRTPDGLVFIEPGGNAYLTDGRDFSNISSQIARFDHNLSGNSATHYVVSPGRGAFLNGFLFMPKGYVLDWATKAWFKTDSFTAAFLSADPYSGTVLGASQGSSFSMKSWQIFEQQPGTTRVSTAYFRSAPYSRPDGRQVEIREVQLFLTAYGTTDVVVTVNGTARTVSGLAAGRHQIPFLFAERGEMLDVKVETTNTAAGEAPTIERMRVAFGKGHQLP